MVEKNTYSKLALKTYSIHSIYCSVSACLCYTVRTLSTSVAVPERFDADPYPTFQADADPDPKYFSKREKICFLPNLHFFSSL